MTRPRPTATAMGRMRVRMSENDKGGCKGESRRHAKMMVMRGEDEGDKYETDNEDQSDGDGREESLLADNRDDAHRAPSYKEPNEDARTA